MTEEEFEVLKSQIETEIYIEVFTERLAMEIEEFLHDH